MKVLFFILLYSALIADPFSQKVFNLYQSGNYHKACQIGLSKISPYRFDESFISLVGFSCLKDDKIDQLSLLLPYLNQTPDARANSAYFSMLIMQKNLLMQSLYDKKPMKNLRFPTGDHLLSKIFALYLQNPQIDSPLKEFSDPSTPRLRYKLYPIDIQGRKSIALDEYYDNILTVHHVY